MGLAKVTSTAPLKVQVRGATTDTAVVKKHSTVPALSVGDDVEVEVLDGWLTVKGKLVDA